jgi:hypothetical protein
MKTLITATMAIMLTTAAFAQAPSDYAAVKKDMKETNKEASSIKKEKKEERKALRKLEGKQASYQAKQQFAQDFDNVTNVEWKRTNYFDEATFTKDGHTMTAFYDYQNQLVGTTEIKTFTDLPASAQNTINKKYKDYSIEKVIMFDDNEDNESDMLLYGHQFDDADNYFVELQKDNNAIILQVDMLGNVTYFTNMR